MPRPRLVEPDRFWTGWFDLVPAYRLATLRVVLAIITLVFHVPKFNRLIADYTASSFHVPPAFPWIPVLPPTAGMALMSPRTSPPGACSSDGPRGSARGFWPRRGST